MKIAKLKISVIVPAYNEEELLADCLDSLNSQTLNRKLYEVIVVNNASVDRTEAIARSKKVKVVQELKKGYINALNSGIQSSQGEIIAFTDADCRVPSHWLSTIYNHFQQDDTLDAVGGIYNFFGAPTYITAPVEICFNTSGRFFGGNMAIKKNSFERIGGFSKDINSGADTLLSIKIQKTGKVIIDRSLVVATSARRFADNLPDTAFRHITNYFSLIFLSRPFFINFSDIRRATKQQSQKYLPKLISQSSFVTSLVVVFFLIGLFQLINPSKAYSKEIKQVTVNLTSLHDKITRSEIFTQISTASFRNK